jgi:hypothetical protein
MRLGTKNTMLWKGGRNMQADELYKDFKITSVCRADLLSSGVSEEEVACLDDGDMTELASKMAEVYCGYDDGQRAGTGN